MMRRRDRPLLTIDQLAVDINIEGHWSKIVQDLSFDVAEGESLGLVGESGSGKSISTRSIMQLLPENSRVSGSITFDGEDVMGMSRSRLRDFRSREVSMIHQDPRAHTNPLRTIGDFLCEGVRSIPAKERHDLATSTLRDVGILDADRRMKQYPHQLSGGLLQRVMIAAAIMPGPRLILADEPTTALDVTTQSEVMAVLDEARLERGLAMVFITHDLDLAAAVTDRLAVMYAGTIVEIGATSSLQEAAKHPYSLGLMGSQPSSQRGRRLHTIPGRPIAAYEAGTGCAFASRCEFVEERCHSTVPEPRKVEGSIVRCHRADEPAVHAAFANQGAS